jgi:hypothetical protein
VDACEAIRFQAGECLVPGRTRDAGAGSATALSVGSRRENGGLAVAWSLQWEDS